MFILKSTHLKLMASLQDDAWHDGYNSSRNTIDLLQSQVDNLKNQLSEAKRRQADGRFKKTDGDFLTR